MASLISENAAEHINFGRNLMRQPPPSMLQNLPLLPSIIAIIEDYIPMGAPVIAAQMALEHPERNLLQCLPVSRRISLLQTYRLAEVSDSAENLTMKAIQDVNFCIQSKKGKFPLIKKEDFSDNLFFEYLHLDLQSDLKTNKNNIGLIFIKNLHRYEDVTDEQILETMRIFIDVVEFKERIYGEMLINSVIPERGFKIFDLLFRHKGLPQVVWRGFYGSPSICLIRKAAVLKDQEAIKVLDYTSPKDLNETVEWTIAALHWGNLPVANNLISRPVFRNLPWETQQDHFASGLKKCVDQIQNEGPDDIKLLDNRLKTLETFFPKLTAEEKQTLIKIVQSYPFELRSAILKIIKPNSSCTFL